MIKIYKLNFNKKISNRYYFKDLRHLIRVNNYKGAWNLFKIYTLILFLSLFILYSKIIITIEEALNE